MAKMKIISTRQFNTGKGVHGVDRRWKAPRLENKVKNWGTRMIKKAKKG